MFEPAPCATRVETWSCRSFVLSSSAFGDDRTPDAPDPGVDHAHQPSSSRPAVAARREYAHVTRTGEPEDEAAVKAEAMAIVAQAKKDIKLREEARGEMKKASTKDDIQALINKRLAQSFADRPKAPEKPKEAPPAKKEAPKEAPPDPEATKKEAAAIVAAANKDYKQRLADREKAKTATAEDLQAMINAKLNISK
jgi:hypothetical protein